MSAKITTALVIVVVIVLAGLGIYKIATAPKIATPDVASKNGLHWHAHLAIEVNGVDVPVPANIGVNGPMGAGGDPMELHTHEPDGVVHAEFAGMVTYDMLDIGNFFKVWGKDFSQDSILGNTSASGGTITMYVNGVENTEYDAYSITGKGTYDAGNLGMIDDIKIVYTSAPKQ